MLADISVGMNHTTNEQLPGRWRLRQTYCWPARFALAAKLTDPAWRCSDWKSFSPHWLTYIGSLLAPIANLA